MFQQSSFPPVSKWQWPQSCKLLCVETVYMEHCAESGPMSPFCWHGLTQLMEPGIAINFKMPQNVLGALQISRKIWFLSRRRYNLYSSFHLWSSMIYKHWGINPHHHNHPCDGGKYSHPHSTEKLSILHTSQRKSVVETGSPDSLNYNPILPSSGFTGVFFSPYIPIKNKPKFFS